MSYDYKGVEIVSELLLNPSGVKGAGKIKQKQLVDVRCSKCHSVKSVTYQGHVTNRLKSKYEHYMCHTCVNSLQITDYNKNNLGISLDDRLGLEKSKIVKSKLRKYAIDNDLKSRLVDFTGTTWDSLYGKEKAEEKRKLARERCKFVPKYGSDNPQWGKPAHKLSGKGTKGYYNGIYFRSLMEASFMINYLEKNDLKFENGELKKYAIPYILDGSPRNYFCDFVVDHIFYEIKPKALHNTLQNREKWKAAELWCAERNYIFEIYSEHDFDILQQKDIDNLKECGKLILI